MSERREGVNESSRPSSQSLFIPAASSPLIRQLQTLSLPPHNERVAAVSMALSVVGALSK